MKIQPLITIDINSADNAGYCYLCSELQRSSGARISEVLSLTWRDITDNGYYYIRSRKGGVPRICYNEYLAQYAQLHRGPDNAKVIPLTYRQIYSYYIKHGIDIMPSSHKRNRAVTHAYRHAIARLAYRLSSGTIQAVSHTLGHRSTKSANYYIGG
jgi:integrase